MPRCHTRNLSRRTFLLLGSLLTGLASVVRLRHLAHDSFWFDELTTVLIAQEGVAVAAQGQIHHPPLHYVVTALGVAAWGEGEFAARLPAAMIGVLAIPLLLRLGHDIGQPWAAVWAALGVALLPFHLRYAQEARDYAFLMTTSLLTYVIFWRAWQRGRPRDWLAFGLATALNLYTHYGALLVLVTQLMLWSAWWLADRQRSVLALRSLLLSLLLAGMLYVPWLPRVYDDLFSQIGRDASGLGVTGVTPLGTWLRVIVAAFGFDYSWLPLATVSLAGLGVLRLLLDRSWRVASFLVAAASVPVLLITVFQISRGAFPKYVIYTLPPYWLMVGMGILWLWRPVVTWLRTPARASALFLLAAAGLSLAAWPLLQREVALMESDWRGVARHLAAVGEPGDVLLSVTLDLPDGYNDKLVLPYYLDRFAPEMTYLADPTATQLAALQNSNSRVWGVALSRATPVMPLNERFLVTSFTGGLYVIAGPTTEQDSLAQMDAMLTQVTAVAARPGPRCLFLVDRAQVAAVADDMVAAEALLTEALTLCPDVARQRPDAAYQLPLAIYRGLLLQAVPDSAESRRLARAILRLDPKAPLAWDVLAVVDLVRQFEAGDSQVEASESPEPVTRQRFTMPQDGDWEDVIFMHPPASATFTLDLPEAPAAFTTRVALAPESWPWGGDGVTFVVEIEPVGGDLVEIGRLVVTKQPADQRWHPVTLSLAAYAGERVQLTLRTDAGPAGDATGDWAGWGAPRIIWQE